MLSMPPATTTSAEPARKRSWAIMAAFMPEPHILLMVVAPAARPHHAGRSAPRPPRGPPPRRILQVAEKSAHGRTRRGNDNDGIRGGHGVSLRWRWSGLRDGLSATPLPHL